MPSRQILSVLFAVGALGACSGSGEPEAEPAEEVPEKCKNVHLDNLATDWVEVKGAAANPKTRIRVMADGDGYKAWYIGGLFTRHILGGIRWVVTGGPR